MTTKREYDIARSLATLAELTSEEWEVLPAQQRFYAGLVLGKILRFYQESKQREYEEDKPDGDY